MKSKNKNNERPFEQHTITKKEIHQLSQLKRQQHHPLVHKIHKKHKISYKTLFYMKEYGPRSHVATVIVKESLGMLIIAAVLSSIGGMYVKSIETKLIAMLPLLILLPALSDMIGDYGTIISSKFTTMLYLGKVGKEWWKSPELRHLVRTILMIATVSVFYVAALATGVSVFKGFPVTMWIFLRVLAVALLATMALIGIILVISITGGYYIFQKHEDPNNMLIPITTSVADLGTLALFTAMVAMFF